MPKGDLIERAFKTIELFNRGPVTTKLAMEKLGIKNRTNAARWIRICSKHLPIVEDGEVQDDGRVPGRRFKVWRLME